MSSNYGNSPSPTQVPVSCILRHVESFCLQKEEHPLKQRNNKDHFRGFVSFFLILFQIQKKAESSRKTRLGKDGRNDSFNISVYKWSVCVIGVSSPCQNNGLIKAHDFGDCNI